MIVFSDLDGTLLDHDTYSWHAAQPALEALQARRVPLVLVSSKTLAELADYREQLSLAHPVVGENGASIEIPANYFEQRHAPPDIDVTRAQIQRFYETLKQTGGYACEAFFEMGTAGIVEATGLSPEAAMRANERQASEPILWLDNEDRLAEFTRASEEHGLRCVRGGRFLHLMADTSKAHAVRSLMGAYSGKYPGRLSSLSLGDGPNDLDMLASTDIAVVIPGKHPHDMNVASDNRVLHPAAAGPAGWNEAVLTILDELDLANP